MAVIVFEYNILPLVNSQAIILNVTSQQIRQNQVIIMNTWLITTLYVHCVNSA